MTEPAPACGSDPGMLKTTAIVARIFADMRAFRICDGPSEVHRRSIAKKIVRRAGLTDQGMLA
jgi:alkylation response protein AidB-like acyl-CoA dehydrogenase